MVSSTAKEILALLGKRASAFSFAGMVGTESTTHPEGFVGFISVERTG